MPAAFSDGDLQTFDSPPALSEDDLGLRTRAKRSSLRDEVHEALRAALITGRMRPGVLYSAPALAEMLGVSATPVREAMIDLAKEDLVVAVRNKGFRVTEVSDRVLDELVEARMLLEVPTMGAVAEQYEPSMEPEMSRLRGLARDLEVAADSNDIGTFLQLDTEFHTSFLALHGNSEIVKIVRQLRGRNRLRVGDPRPRRDADHLGSGAPSDGRPRGGQRPRRTGGADPDPPGSHPNHLGLTRP